MSDKPAWYQWLNNRGTSEGARKGWLKRKGGGWTPEAESGTALLVRHGKEFLERARKDKEAAMKEAKEARAIIRSPKFTKLSYDERVRLNGISHAARQLEGKRYGDSPQKSMTA